MIVPFRPAAQSTVTVAATTTSGSTRVAYSAFTAPQTVRIYAPSANSGDVFLTYGDNAITASASTSLPIAPGNVEVLTLAGGYVAAIMASGTGTIYITPGDGN